jgi:hypothetical protein
MPVENKRRGMNVFDAIVIKRQLWESTSGAGTSTGVLLTALASEVNKLSGRGIGAPVFGGGQGSTGSIISTAASRLTLPIDFRRASLNDTGLMTERTMCNYWFETTAGAYLTVGQITTVTVAASTNGVAGTTVGGSPGTGVVISGAALASSDARMGRFITDSTGHINLSVTSSGSGLTCILYFSLPNGQVVTGSTFVFT